MSGDYVSDPLFRDAGRVERLKPAVIKLLRTIPETWTECDPSSWTLEEESAYRLLTAVGVIERRGTLRFGMVHHPTSFEVQFQATGTGAFADAMRWAVSRAYNVWGDAWRAWRAANHDDDPYYHDPFRVQAVQPQEVRLLFGKILLAACSGVSASSLPKSEVIQRYVDTLTGKPVHGSARLLQLRECESPATAGGVGDRFDWFAVTLKAMLNQHFLDDRNPPDATEGASVPEDAQGDALAALTKAETPSTPEALWKRSGAMWHIRAFGEEGHFPDLTGFRYIAALLSKPGERVPMRELTGIKRGDTPREAVIDEAMSESEYSPQAVMDEQALRALYEEVRNTRAAIEKARINHNATECAILEAELHRLQSQVKAATRPGGIPRNFTRSIDKARPSILNALRRAYRQLRDGGLPETARHLEISIRTTGRDCVYQPARPVHWKVVTPDVTK